MAIPYASNYDETLAFSDACYQIALNSNNGQNFTVPGTPEMRYIAIFGYSDNANIYVGQNRTAVTPPAGTITQLQGVECRPCKRYVKGGDVLSFVSPDTTAYIGVSLRSVR